MIRGRVLHWCDMVIRYAREEGKYSKTCGFDYEMDRETVSKGGGWLLELYRIMVVGEVGKLGKSVGACILTHLSWRACIM